MWSRVTTAALIVLAVTCAGCDRKSATNERAAVAPAATRVADSAAAPAESSAATSRVAAPSPVPVPLPAPTPPPSPAPRYLRVRPAGARALTALRDSLGPAGWLETLKVNRLDSAFVRIGEPLIVPDPSRDSLALAPFPRTLEAARDSSKLLLIALRVQAFAAYDSGRLVRWGPTSSGRKAKPTPVGLYHTNWKDTERFSTIDEAWLLKWYVNIQNFEGVSLHEYELPGHPASHSCVRLLAQDAQWIYAWCEQWRLSPDGRTILRPGTPVLVFGEFAWTLRSPWRSLPENPHATDVTAEEIVAALRDAGPPVFPPADSLQAPGAADSLRARAIADSLRARIKPTKH
jgi:hypothetical protein